MYWILVFALAWALTLPSALAQMELISRSPLPWQAGILIGAVPALAAIIVSARKSHAKSFLRSVLRLQGPLWCYALAVALPLVALLLAWLVNPGIPLGLDSSLLAFAALWLVLALGEEIGWRGYALPRLAERFGFWVGSSILGIAWCVWHFPRLLGSPFVSSLSEALPLIGAFSVQIVLANVILCWLFYRTGRSVIAPTLFHATMNVVATAYFMAATDWAVTGFFLACVVAIAFDRPGALQASVADEAESLA